MRAHQPRYQARYHPRELEPLLAPEPDAASPDVLRPAPTLPWWRTLLGEPIVEDNTRELAADLAPIGTSADGRPAYRRKRIVICADGTWNTPAGRRDEDASTNVWRMFELVTDRAADGMPQLKYYHAGVGTTGSKLQRLVDGASGRGLSANMQDCYDFLVRHYHPGDAVYLFGFSRGAYTARALAGLIRNSGIVDMTKPKSAEVGREALLRRAYALYRNRQPDTAPVASRSVEFRAKYAHPDFHIACIGVWDTVGALGIPVETGLLSPLRWFNSRVAFHDVTLSSYVDCAFQALALDEQRSAFVPTLWQQQPHARAAGQVLEQVWFAGAHADVGGGYPASERGLADVALRWMVNRVSDTCGLELDPRPLVTREGEGSFFVVHDSMGVVYQAANAVGLMRRFSRAVDGGLCEDGIRDAASVVTEALHRSAEEFVAGARRVERQRPIDPANVRDYLERRRRQRGVAEPPRGVDRRRAVADAADIDEIVLERLAEGRTIATLVFSRDGQARRDEDAGGTDGPTTSATTGTVSPEDFAGLADSVIASGLLGFGERYAGPVGRDAGIAITVASGRRRKRVETWDRWGPARLEDVERAIEALERRVDWAPC